MEFLRYSDFNWTIRSTTQEQDKRAWKRDLICEKWFWEDNIEFGRRKNKRLCASPICIESNIIFQQNCWVFEKESTLTTREIEGSDLLWEDNQIDGVGWR